MPFYGRFPLIEITLAKRTPMLKAIAIHVGCQPIQKEDSPESTPMINPQRKPVPPDQLFAISPALRDWAKPKTNPMIATIMITIISLSWTNWPHNRVLRNRNVMWNELLPTKRRFPDGSGTKVGSGNPQLNECVLCLED